MRRPQDAVPYNVIIGKQIMMAPVAILPSQFIWSEANTNKGAIFCSTDGISTASMPSSSYLMDSTTSSASSILGASTMNLQKANRPVEGRPRLGFGRQFSSLSFGDVDEEKGEGDSVSISRQLDKQDSTKDDEDHYHLLQKRRYPVTISISIPKSDFPSESPTRQTTTTKTELERAVLWDCLSSHFLFAHLPPSELHALSKVFDKVQFQSGETILSKGDPATYFYVLFQGEVRTMDDEGKEILPLYESADDAPDDDKYAVLGELALLTATPHEATIEVASTACTLFRLNRIHLQRALVHHTSLKAQIPLVESALPQSVVEYLHEYPVSFQKLVAGMNTLFFSKGDVLYEPNPSKVGGAVIIIAEGIAEAIELSDQGEQSQDKILIGPEQTGTIFGWSCIVQEPAAASLVATTDGKALVILKKAFYIAIGYHDGMDISMMQYLAEKRLMRKQLSQITILRDSMLDDTQIDGLIDLFHHREYTEETAIFKARDKVEAAVYLVREGSVVLVLDRGKTRKTIEAGGHFGENNLLLDQNKLGHKHLEIRAPFAAIAQENTKVDMLYVEECRKVINTKLLGLGRPVLTTAIDSSMQWADLTRHTMLGAGSFGQVWLASSSNESQLDRSSADDSSTRRIVALKIQAKYTLVQSMEQAERVVAERNIMASLYSPFLIRLFNSFQDQDRLYMITSLLQGGELESIIPEDGLSESAAKFYAAGILEGLTYMHRRHIIHRDVKTENVLIDDKGYPVLIDLGFAKYVPDKTYTFCGSPMFTAPEVIRYKGHDKGCDHWSWAVLVFRLVTGKYPFYKKGMDELALYKRICRGSFELDGLMSIDFRMLMVAILYPDPTQRLGSRIHGWRDIFGCPWFANDVAFDLRKLHRQNMPAPWVPTLKDPLDASKFHHDFSDVEDLASLRFPSLTLEQQEIFDSYGQLID